MTADGALAFPVMKTTEVRRLLRSLSQRKPSTAEAEQARQALRLRALCVIAGVKDERLERRVREMLTPVQPLRLFS